MSKTTSRRNKTSVKKTQWAAYAAAGAASAMVSGAAEANVTHVVLNADFNAFTAGTSVIAGVPLDGSASFVMAHFPLATSVGVAVAVATGVNSGMIGGFQAGPYQYVLNIASGQNVSTISFVNGTATMAFGSGYGNDQFLGAGIGFIGFKFDGGAGTQYGWVRVDMDGSPGNSFDWIDIAWAMPGEAITAGQTASAIPLPGSLGLLASGAAGLMAWRRKRKEAALAA